MNLDLTGLAEVAQPAAGEPLMVPLDAIDRDAGQPRQHFDEAALQELAESIRAEGVVQPISVKPDPAAPGRYIINYGERRFRAALIAGLRAIPAFVHRTPDSYTQVTENLHRADLSPMEMALFIRRRMDAGETRSAIAARLGYGKSYVTEHLALLESPACVEKAYANGVASARTLYDLRRLHDEFPEQVDAWCASGIEVTREAIFELGQRVRHDEQLAGQAGAIGDTLGTVVECDNIVRHDEQLAVAGHADSPGAPPLAESASVALTVPEPSSNDAGTAAIDKEHGAAPADSTARRTGGEGSPNDDTRRERHAGAPRVGQSDRSLRVKVKHSGREAMVDEESVVRIRYGDGEVAEVRLADTLVVAVVAGH
ncbi:ParB/RepB/Spo0J family partition protein [uncultured Massilia sp.]|uniref:ParB/RepB/Spo0J family partition protein n=1 Tax=uncultured Massilia sp. TaxID=169973 RepID=UPI0025E303C3|nr:ParB/RepB/Spo0J family partition protein [uncultured Massilia sp.]